LGISAILRIFPKFLRTLYSWVSAVGIFSPANEIVTNEIGARHSFLPPIRLHPSLPAGMPLKRRKSEIGRSNQRMQPISDVMQD
jgi:hypothetical protein